MTKALTHTHTTQIYPSILDLLLLVEFIFIRTPHKKKFNRKNRRTNLRKCLIILESKRQKNTQWANKRETTINTVQIDSVMIFIAQSLYTFRFFFVCVVMRSAQIIRFGFVMRTEKYWILNFFLSQEWEKSALNYKCACFFIVM